MTNFDIITIVTIFIFVTIGFFKGGIGSILSLLKWYGAGVASVLFYPVAKEFSEEILGKSVISSVVAVFCLYILALIILIIISKIISIALKSIIGGAVDRFAGLLIGLTIGFVIISSAHYIVTNTMKEEPEWLANGKTYELTKFGADNIGKLINSDFSGMMSDFGLDLDSIKEKAANMNSESAPLNGLEPENLEEPTNNLNVEKIRKALEELKAEGYGKEEAKQKLEEMIKNNEQDFRLPENQPHPDYEPLSE
jgi:uncharacterized membrane protein required for colicin V production